MSKSKHKSKKPDPFPAFLQSKLRLFLSVDLVGSTAFKQRALEETRSVSGSRIYSYWLEVVTEFYRKIDELFFEEWDNLASAQNSGALQRGERPVFWKTLGDELLYTKVLTHHSEALTCLYAWIKAVGRYKDSLKEKSLLSQLSVKCTAWLAGFPINNSEVIVSTQGNPISPIAGTDHVFENMTLLDNWYNQSAKIKREGVLDFVGPSIDIGFRLAGHSTKRKMAISVELALLAVSAQFNAIAPDNHKPLRIFYGGGTALKGVLDGEPYPWFWIDLSRDDERNTLEENLFSDNKEAIKTFCLSFFEGHPDFVKPYICGGNDNLFHDRPKSHPDLQQALLSGWTDYRKKIAEEAEALKHDSDASARSGDPAGIDQVLDDLPR
ncbi:conserved hypothetical protein [Magnetospirillum sp. LM-5]|uniref:hypothetical protein n=1 Tax=Magnetospirillum sp. LM-5 TaxID=2681466 RepID=UPI001383C942|nr:hypothetical protein [Magnetospirillum sp. LM-5]CAA7621750.1 conserved hypothetical protein [Magnetospirillum sp. LM-5]